MPLPFGVNPTGIRMRLTYECQLNTIGVDPLDFGRLLTWSFEYYAIAGLPLPPPAASLPLCFASAVNRINNLPPFARFSPALWCWATAMTNTTPMTPPHTLQNDGFRGIPREGASWAGRFFPAGAFTGPGGSASNIGYPHWLPGYTPYPNTYRPGLTLPLTHAYFATAFFAALPTDASRSAFWVPIVDPSSSGVVLPVAGLVFPPVSGSRTIRDVFTTGSPHAPGTPVITGIPPPYNTGWPTAADYFY